MGVENSPLPSMTRLMAYTPAKAIGLLLPSRLYPVRAGFKPDRALFGKNVGALPSYKFSDINIQKHSVDTCELYAILLLLSKLRVETRLSALESFM